MASGVESLSKSPVLRALAVIVWFVISTIAYVSRYERFNLAMAVLMAVVIVAIGVGGLVWAILPALKGRQRRGA